MIDNPIDGDIDLDHKDLLMMGSKQETSKQGIFIIHKQFKDYYELEDKQNNYPISYHKESFEFDSKMHGYSRYLILYNVLKELRKVKKH